MDAVNEAIVSIALSLSSSEETKAITTTKLITKPVTKSPFTLAVEKSNTQNIPLVIFVKQKELPITNCHTLRYDDLTLTDDIPCVFIYRNKEWYKIKGNPTQQQIENEINPKPKAELNRTYEFPLMQQRIVFSAGNCSNGT